LEFSRWTNIKCQVDEHHAEIDNDAVMVDNDANNSSTQLIYKSVWIAPLIAPNISKMPMVLNKVLRAPLEPYGKPYCFTEVIFQKAQTDTRQLMFGGAQEKVGYANFVKDDLLSLRHFVSLTYTTQKEALQNLEKIVISDEMLRRKEAKLSGLQPTERIKFVRH
jgi:hypothetical protein